MLYREHHNKTVRETHTVIDIFAGCGGLSLGLYEAGWNGIFAIEKNPCAFETLKYNLFDKKHHFTWPDWLPVLPLDIIEVNKKYRKNLIALRGSVDLVAGGPPCQGFSMAGKRVRDDIRNQLVFSYIDFIKNIMPKMLLFENVKGFTSAFDKKTHPDSRPYSAIVTEKLQALGYDVDSQIVDFSQLGVPQRRKRFILVGVRGDLNKNPSDFFTLLYQHSKTFLKKENLPLQPTVYDAISDLLRSNGEIETPDRKHFMSGLYGSIRSPYQAYMRSGINVMVPNSHSFAHHSEEKVARLNNLLRNYPERGKRIDRTEKVKWGIRQRGLTILDASQIAPTITNMPDDYVHYCEPRIMTVRECARIQSFPDWFEFKSKYTTGGAQRKKEVPRYSQVGNAIPPLFAMQAGLVIKEMLNER